jgi:plastocyanin
MTTVDRTATTSVRSRLAARAPGTYKFHCDFHSDMHGTLIVK